MELQTLNTGAGGALPVGTVPEPVAAPTLPIQTTPSAPPTPNDILQAGQVSADAAKQVGVEAAKAGEAVGREEQAAADSNTAAADEIRHVTERHQTALANARSETEAAYRAARDTHVQDFWEGRTGAKVASAIAVGLGGAASILGRVGGNSTYDILKDQIDQHYRNEKQRIDSAFHYAEAKGKLTDDMRMAYATELADIQAAHAATNASVAAKIRSVTAQSKGRVDQATANLTADKLEADTLDTLQKNEQNRIGLELQKQHYSATEAMARAQLGMQREQINATRENRDMVREDRKLAAENRKTAAQEKAQAALDARTVRDYEGNSLGYAPNARSVGDLGKTVAQTKAYVDKVEELAAHIEQHGHLMNPLSEEYKRRETLIGEVQSAGRLVQGIQASDAGQKLEHMIIGGSGTGLHRAADPTVLRELAKRGSDLTMHRLKATLTPLKGESVSRSPEFIAPFKEGEEAVNPQTGETLTFRGGKWVK